MKDYQHIPEPLPELKFDKRRSRVKYCPCGKDNKDGKFAPYVGFENKGYCHSCGDTFFPEIQKAEQWNTPQPKYYAKPNPQLKIDFILLAVYQKQLSNGIHLYNQNNFIQWLKSPHRGIAAFDNKTVTQLIETYLLGNSGKDKYKGWILFPYIDIQNRLCDIKVMDYNPTTGKRISKKNGDSIERCYFIAKEILNNPGANTVRCFFGESLLKGNNKVVLIFESEATAVYSAPFYPDCICIATGGNNGCKWTDKDKCKVLQGRTVILYPDIDAYDSWEQKAEILRGYGIKVQVSQLIKCSALRYAEQSGIEYSELVKQKFDLRDILKHKDLNEFKRSEPKPTQPAPAVEPFPVANIFQPVIQDYQFTKPGPRFERSKPIGWGTEIKELEIFFTDEQFSKQPVKLNQCSTITNVSLFIETHFATIKANDGKKTFIPFLHRLQELKQLLTIN